MHGFVYYWQFRLHLSLLSIYFCNEQRKCSQSVSIEDLAEDKDKWRYNELSLWYRSHIAPCYSWNQSVMEGLEIIEKSRSVILLF